MQLEMQADGKWGIVGTVTNETKWDFKYFAVCIADYTFVYKNLPAGLSVKLEEAEMVYDEDDVGSFGYGILKKAQEREWEKDADILTALMMGMSFAWEDSDVVVMTIGVTEDWDKVVDDNCSEVSYGCLYTVQ